MQTLAITGGSGFVGTNLIKYFLSLDFDVIKIKREELKDPNRLIAIIEKSDFVINLAGANIINRWSDSYKKLLYSSRIDTTKALIAAMKVSKNKPKLFISTSAVGIYNTTNCNDEVNYEYADDFLAKLCMDWENEALKAKEFGIRTAIFRFGIVLGGGGALGKMITPFKLGLGGTIKDGKQYFPFIQMDDLLEAYRYLFLNENLDGIFNLTAPNTATNKQLTKSLGKLLNRPTVLPIPEFILNLIFSEGAKVLTTGQCVIPKKLLDAKFIFKYPTIQDALKRSLQ